MCNAVIHFRVLKKKGWLIDGDRGEGALQRRRTLESPREVLRQWRLLYAESRRDFKKKATYSDVHWIFHSRLSFCVLTDFHIVTNSVCVCECVRRACVRVCVCVCVCVCVNFYFSCHSLYLLFVGVFCSVCIIGESLIFLLSWKWMTFALLKNIIYKFCGFFLSDKLRLISLYEKGWNLKKKKTEGKDIKGIYHLVLAGHDGTGLYRLWNLRSKFVLFSLPEDFLFGDLSSVTFTIASLTLSWRTSTVWL